MAIRERSRSGERLWIPRAVPASGLGPWLPVLLLAIGLAVWAIALIGPAPPDSAASPDVDAPSTAGSHLTSGDPPPPALALPASDRATASTGGSGRGDCPTAASRLFLPAILRGSGDAPAPGFSLAPDSDCLTIVQGYTGTLQINVSAIGGFGDRLALSVDGLPAGVQAGFSPTSVVGSGSSRLTFEVGRSTNPGTYRVPLLASAGTLTKSVALSLIVVQPLTVSGTVQDDRGAGLSGAGISARTADGQAAAQTTTGAGGTYTFELPAVESPAKVVITATLAISGQSPTSNSKWQTFGRRGAVQAEPIALPNPAGAEMPVQAGMASTSDQSVVAEGLPATIGRLYGRAYDPDANRAAFPGEFAEAGRIPLNSAGFVWLQAETSAGVQVSELGQPVTLRSKVPKAQWADLQDIQSGTDRIDLPMYTYDESTQTWQPEPNGWLEDENRLVLPEEAGPLVLGGRYPLDVFAVYTATHFSFKNVDYPYIGPWTLSRMDREKRNNDCLYEAMKLAKAIALSPKGKAAYGKVNQTGADLSLELADGKGPELKTSDLEWTEDSQTNGEYNGDNMRGDNPEDEIVLNNKIWDLCDQPGKKKEIILLLASTILHETAHWKDDVKKNPNAGDRTAPDGPKDTRGEEGKQLERDLFGGDLHYDPTDGRLELDDQPIDGSVLDDWSNPDSWTQSGSGTRRPAAPSPAAEAPSPLQITLTLRTTEVGLLDPILVDVRYTNAGARPIQVPKVIRLEDYPLRFDIVQVETGKLVGYLGGEIHARFGQSAYVTLQPGQALTLTVDLRYEENGQRARYNLGLPSTYQVKAVYSPFFGLPETESNSLTFSVLPTGGSVAGVVTGQGDGRPIGGARILPNLDGVTLAATDSGADGRYAITNLPPGTYTVTATALGYRRVTRTVDVITRTETPVNFSLPSLTAELVYGQTLTGTIDVPGEVFSYTLSGTAGDQVLVRMGRTGGSLTPHLAIVRPDGSRVCDEGTFSAGLEVHCRLDSTGTHTIRAGDYSNENTGSYGLHVQRTNDPARAGRITYGGTVSGTLAVAQAGAYTFSGAVGDPVLIRLARESGNLTPFGSVYRPDGTRLCNAGTFGSGLEVRCTLDAAGPHTLLAGDYSITGSGRIGLHLQRQINPAGATPIAFGSALTGTIAPAQAGAYTFGGSAGDRVLVRMARITGSLTPQIEVTGPSGRQVCLNGTFGAGLEVLCTLDATGTHAIFAAGYNVAGSGTYGLYLQRTNGPAGATPVAYGENRSGALDRVAEADAFTFAGTADDHVLIRIARTTGNLTPQIQVYGPDGTRVCSRGTFGAGLEVLCPLTATGSHTIAAADYSGSGTGTYGVHVQRTNGPAGATAIADGESRTGALTTAAEADAYTFSGTAGETVQVRVTRTSGNVTPLIEVYRPDGTELCARGTFSAELEVQCLLDGTGSHAVIVADYSGSGTGDYSLSLAKGSPPSR